MIINNGNLQVRDKNFKLNSFPPNVAAEHVASDKLHKVWGNRHFPIKMQK